MTSKDHLWLWDNQDLRKSVRNKHPWLYDKALRGPEKLGQFKASSKELQFKTSNSGDGLSTIHTVHTYDGALEVNSFVFFSVLLKSMFGATSPASIMIGPCLNSCVGFFDDICQCPLNHVLLKLTTLPHSPVMESCLRKKELPPTKASHFLSETTETGRT